MADTKISALPSASSLTGTDIKISALNPASPLTGREMIPAVQDGFPVKVYVSNVPIYVDNVIEKYTNEINVDKLYPLSEGYYTLQTAINAIQNNALKKSGIKITFKTNGNVYETWQFKSSSENWLDINNWELQPKRLEISQLNTLLNSVSLLAESLSNLIKPITENGFNVIDENGNIGMKYDGNGLDASLLSSHFQDLINGLINLGISTAKGYSIAPLVNSLIPAVYLPSFVDDAVEINLFGTSAIEEYCSANDGNTTILEDKFAFDDENKVFVIARQIGTSIYLIDAGVPEKGKIYTDTSTNRTYRWGDTTMVPIGNDMVLGEDTATAYPGDKGKANADNIATLLFLCSKLNISVAGIKSQIIETTDDGLFICDSNGNVAAKYDSDGLDFSELSTHAVTVLNNAGISGGDSSLTFETVQTI